MRFRWMVLVSLLPWGRAAPAATPGGTYRITEQTVRHRAVLDVAGFAETSVPIHNPLRWPQIRDVVPDGSLVQAGDVLARFDASGPSNDLERARLGNRTAEAELARDTADIDNSQLDLRDRRDALRDQVAVLEARLARLRAVPDPSEVAIAASRLRVATLAWEAASNDFAKAEARFRDNLISRQELESREDDRDSAGVERTHAATSLTLARRPTPPHELRRVELELDNARAEAVKLDLEIADNDVLVEIRKRGASARRLQLARQIAEREEDLQSTRVLAPIDGHVMYMPDFRLNVLEAGDRMWRNSVFLRMPDPSTLAFKGVIPEASRRFFEVGDRATLRLVGFKGVEVPATVTSISTTARDTADRDTVGWGESREYGVKVHDIVLRPDVLEDWMRVGAHAQAVVNANRPLTAPAVPLPYVRFLDGKPHLAYGGRLLPAEGTVSGDFLVLEDPAWLGRTIELHPSANPSQARARGTSEPAAGADVLFSTSGELVPATSTPVVIGRIHRWQKITWLIPEDSVVTQGTVVVRIDDKESLDEILDWESRLTTATGERETQEQNQAIQGREQAYQLAVASNNAAIARIDYEAAQASPDEKAIADARRSLDLSLIRERSAQRRLERLVHLPPERVAAVERVAAERALERATLNREADAIRLAQAEDATSALDLERLRVAYEEARLALHARATTVKTDRIRAEAELLKARRREAHTLRNLTERRKRLDNLTVTAPCAGTVRYNRVWNNNAVSRVQVGHMVGSRFIPLQIVDASRMEVRAEIPEPLFPQVSVGQTLEVRIPSATEALLSGTLREVEFLFEQRRPKDSERGLYSSHESLGETVFHIRVEVDTPAGISLKPGAVATLTLRKPKGGTP